MRIALLLLLVACGDQGVRSFNADPTASITSHDELAEIEAGATVVFRGSASDPDDSADRLTATWLVDGAEGCPATVPDERGVSRCELVLDSGRHEISLEVRDPANAVAVDRVNVEACGDVFYRDRDEDGFGDAEDPIIACAAPEGFVEEPTDCDDNALLVNPGQEELCDNDVDDDCDDDIDEGCLGTNCFDDDTAADNTAYYSSSGRLDDRDDPVDAFYRDDVEILADSDTVLGVHGFSSGFDAVVEVYDPDCELILRQEDGARGTNAYTRVRPDSAGIYTVVITSQTPGETGSYVLELFDDSKDPGTYCGADTDIVDVLDDPFRGSFSGNLDDSDVLFPESVGAGFYWDDVEVFVFYGDTVTATHTSSVFDPVLNLYDPGCKLVTYDTDSGDGNAARIRQPVGRTGVYTFTPWATTSWSTGGYTLEIEASF